MRCLVCGTEALTEAQFCGNCGASLAAAISLAVPLPLRDLGGLVGETFRVYRQNFWPFLVIALLAAIPSFLGQLAFPWTLPLALSSVGPRLLLALLGYALSIVAQGAIVCTVAQQYLRGRVDVIECYRRAFRRAIPLLLATLVFGLMLVGSGILILLLVGIPLFFYLLASRFFFSPAVVLEGMGPIAALKRSRDLVRGSWWRVFGIGVVFVLIFLGLGIAVLAPGLILTIFNKTLGSALLTALGALVSPLGAIGTAVVYFDLRARKEGYGLQAMAAEWDARGR